MKGSEQPWSLLLFKFNLLVYLFTSGWCWLYSWVLTPCVCRGCCADGPLDCIKPPTGQLSWSTAFTGQGEASIPPPPWCLVWYFVAGLRQHSHSWSRAPRDPWPYFSLCCWKYNVTQCYIKTLNNLHTFTLKMEAGCASEASATTPISKRRKNPRTGLTSINNVRESLKQ
jgi:hypothetical protein